MEDNIVAIVGIIGLIGFFGFLAYLAFRQAPQPQPAYIPVSIGQDDIEEAKWIVRERRKGRLTS